MFLGGVIAPPAHVQEWALWLAAVVAGLTALGWVYARVRRGLAAVLGWGREWAARFNALDALVTHELQPNSGSSMKDAIDRLEVKQQRHLDEAGTAFDSIDRRLGALEGSLATAADAQRNLWPAIEAVAKAAPPPPDPEAAWPEDDKL